MSDKACPRCGEVKAIECFGLKRRQLVSGVVQIRQSYCKQCRVQMQAKHEKANPDATKAMRRKVKLKRNYGITPEQHSQQVRSQGECCAICKRSLAGLSPQTIHVDHCHATGALRGVLCGPCNVGLGAFRDSEETMLAAIAYLRAGGTWVQSVHSEPGSAKVKQVAA